MTCPAERLLDKVGRVPIASTSPPAAGKRFPVLRYGLVLACIALFALAPLISVLIASAIADKNGCQLDEGGMHPCVLGGTDWGETLGTMFVLGWLMFATLPVGALAFVLWLIVIAVHFSRWSKKRRAALAVAAAVCISMTCGLAAAAEPEPAATAAPIPPKIMMHAKGPFEVKLAPQTTEAPLGRMSIDKQFHGDLEASSKGEMLAAQSGVKGSAGYVAIEQVTGTLGGRQGSFFLQHSGTMDRSVPQLSVTVIPDSGTGELEGLTGRMTIDIADGKHLYDFEYTLPAKP